MAKEKMEHNMNKESKQKETMESDENWSGDKNKYAISTLDHTNNSGKATSVPREGISQPSEWREKPYRCSICRAQYHTKKDIADHMITHPVCAKKHRICPICNISCLSTKGLSKHFSVYHANIPPFFEKEPVFRCDTCPYIAPSFQHFEEHHMKHQGTYRFQCSYCEKPFRNKVLLVIHERNHKGERPFSCNKCGFTFSNPATARVHRESCGDDVMKKHICSVCGKGFKRSSYLHSHQATHNENMPYNCAHCNYQCKRKSNLKFHMFKHTEEMTHICNICSKAFNIRYKLNLHMAMHHGIEVEDQSAPSGNSNPKDKYHCMDCEETFRWKVQLQTHMRKRHKNETSTGKDSESSLCFQCGKVFKNETALEAHLKNRHRIRTAMPYKCVFCVERFSYKPELFEHLKMHENEVGELHIPDVEINKAHANTTDEAENTEALHHGIEVEDQSAPSGNSNPKDKYHCMDCEETFRWKVQLQTHMRKRHKNETSKASESSLCFQRGKVFKRKTVLEAHLKNTHKIRTAMPYKCVFCMEKFSYKPELFEHLKMHENEAGELHIPDVEINKAHTNTTDEAENTEKSYVNTAQVADNAKLPFTAKGSVRVIYLNDIGRNRDNESAKHVDNTINSPIKEKKNVHVIAPLGEVPNETLNVTGYIGEESDNVIHENIHVIAPLGEEVKHVKNDTVDASTTDEAENTEKSYVNTAQVADNIYAKLPFTAKGSVRVIYLNDIGRNRDNESVKIVDNTINSPIKEKKIVDNTINSPIKEKPWLIISDHNPPHRTSRRSHKPVPVIAPLGNKMDHVKHETVHVVTPLGEDPGNVSHETLNDTSHIGEESDNVTHVIIHVIAPQGDKIDHTKQETVHVVAPLDEDPDNASHESLNVTGHIDEESDNVIRETIHGIAPLGEEMNPVKYENVHVIAPLGEDPNETVNVTGHKGEESESVIHETLHGITPLGDKMNHVKYENVHVIAPLGEVPNETLNVTRYIGEESDNVIHENIHGIKPLGDKINHVKYENVHVIAPLGEVPNETLNVTGYIDEESDNVIHENIHGIAPLGEEVKHVKNDTVDVIAPSSKESDKVDGINSPGAEEQGINYCASSRTHKIILINPNGGQKFIINTRIPQDMKKIVLKAQHHGKTVALNVPLQAADTTVVTLPYIRQSTCTVDTVMPSPSTGQIERSSKRNIICNTTATTGNPEDIQHSEASIDVAPHCPSSFLLTGNLSSPAVGDTSQEIGDITLTKRHKPTILKKKSVQSKSDS